MSWALSQRNALYYNPVTIDISEVIEDLVIVFKGIADDKNIKFDTELTALPIRIDLHSFIGICRNLIDNALKFTPVGGTISINYNAIEANLQLCVSDTGVGMTEEQKNKLFKVTALKNTKGTLGETGSGIGLNLVQELVTLNRGTIRAESKIGEGTSFYVMFPDAVI